MIRDDIEKGQRVITRTVELRPGLLVDPQYLAYRQENSEGVVLNPVKDTDGAWWVMHAHGVAPYWYHEFELDDRPEPEPEDNRPYTDD